MLSRLFFMHALLGAFVVCLLSVGCATRKREVSPIADHGVASVLPNEQSESPLSLAPKDASRVIAAPQVVTGSGLFVHTKDAGEVEPKSNDTLQLNFVDTDVRQIVSYLLGDVLGTSFMIDPSVKGTLTLQSSQPLSHDDAMKSLEAALRTQDIALVKGANGYSVVPVKDAGRQSAGIRAGRQGTIPGFGVEVVQLHYVSAVDMERLLKPFSPPDGIVHIDEARNLILISGTSSERDAMRDGIQTFDVNWLSGMSYGMYPVEYADAKTLVDELKEVLSDTKSPLSGIVRLIPLPRLNTVMVASPQPEYLTQISEWIKRLDIGMPAPGRRIYVYDVQNGRAADLATALNDMFGLQSVSRQRTTDGSSYASSSGTSSFGDSGGSGIAKRSSNQSGAGAGGTSLNGAPFFGGTNSSTSGAAVSLDTLGLRLVPSDESNALLVFATPAEFSVIGNAVKRLDVPPLQVLIEATLVEITLTDEIKFGIEWAFRSSRGSTRFSNTSIIGTQFPGFSYLYSGSADLQAALNALESLTRVKVISSPELMVLNNREAQIQVGDQVPILTQQAISTGQSSAPIVNSVQQRDTGVILHVTPRVNKSGMVSLDIEQEVSSVVPTTSSTIDSPTIQERKLSSSVAVRDGESIALGGLIKDNRSTSRGGIPWLSRVPVLGWLFGSTDAVKDRTELLILITPHVVRNSSELSQLSADLKEQFSQAYPLASTRKMPTHALPTP